MMHIKKQIQAYLQTKYELLGFFLLLLSLFGGIFFFGHLPRSYFVLGAELSGFLREWRHLPSVESVLSAPEEAPVPADPASLYALCEALALRTAPATLEALAVYAGRLPAEFGVLLMRDAVRQDPAVVESEPFARWARDNAEVLM